MKRPYRCNSIECRKRNNSNIIHIDPTYLAEQECPFCKKNKYERLTLIHRVKESPDGIIKGSNHNEGKQYTVGCEYGLNEYKRFIAGQRPGNPIIKSTDIKAVTCYDCLFAEEDCVFNPDTNEFDFKETEIVKGD